MRLVPRINVAAGTGARPGCGPMLEQQSDLIRSCYDRAARAKEAADQARFPSDREFFLGVERKWLGLADSQAFADRIGSYLLSQRTQTPQRENVVPLLRNAAFEPPLVHDICAAFDNICRKLGLEGKDPLFEAVARAVMEQARRGNRRSSTLERGALVALGLSAFETDGWDGAARSPQNRHWLLAEL